LSELPQKDPAPADDAEGEPRPGRVRKPIGWSMIVIAVLVRSALRWSIGATASWASRKS
jgi:hypothetical protein